MKRIVIFSGTTEGRILSELLTKEKIAHTVCVASEYGKDMMEENPYAAIHVGRMDEDEMTGFLADQDNPAETIVVDATHPYATEVTSNIKKATEFLNIRYMRVKRHSEDESPTGFHYIEIAECAEAIDKTEGNILLTTGSKELTEYCKVVSEDTRKRTYVRVLPTAESLKICEDAGIVQDHIIAMHGPFGKELNEAIIRQYSIKHLITKDSGVAGGFKEKKDAADACETSLHIIDRPTEEEGMEINEVYTILTGKDMPSYVAEMQSPIKESGDETPTPEVCYVIGAGMGADFCLTMEGKKALDSSDAVFGAERLLKNISCPQKYVMYLAKDIIPVIEAEKVRRPVILFSGDTGFYSGAKATIRELKKWKPDLDIRVIPGISCVSYLASKLHESYDRTMLYSIHGKKTERDMYGLLDQVKFNGKVFVLLSGSKDISVIAHKMIRFGIDGSITAGANLSCENEEIKEMTLDEAARYGNDGIVTALIVNNNPAKRPLINVKKDADFDRTDVPMTKECIRHESIIRLGLREGDTFIDIGGGTGSVAIEAASLHPSLNVFTIEKKHVAAELIERNVTKNRLCNVTVIEGKAEDELPKLPTPDCVFIGGSGGQMKKIVEVLREKRQGIRYVISAVSLETIEEVRGIIRQYEPQDEEAVMIQVSDVEKVGTHHMLKGQNPVWIFSFVM